MSKSIARLSAFCVLIVLACALNGCGDDDAMEDTEDSDSDTGGDSDSDGDTDTDSDTDTDTEISCGTFSAAALAACVEQERYEADLVITAIERPPQSEGWQVVQDICASRLEELGFETELHIYDTGINVIGTLIGDDAEADMVVVSAHYDHVPDCPGADDNASGVAGVLEVARVLSMTSYSNTLVIACWDEEELGKIGSTAWVEHASNNLPLVSFSLVFDMIGYITDEPNSQTFPAGFEEVFPDAAAWLIKNEYRGNFIGLVANTAAENGLLDFGLHADTIDLPFLDIALTDEQINSGLFNDFRRSDHAAFWDAGYPAALICDTAEFRYPAYHCLDGDDVIENLDHAFTTQVLRSTVATAAQNLGMLE